MLRPFQRSHVIGDPWPEEPDDPFPEYLTPFPEYAEPRPAAGAPRLTDRDTDGGTASSVETAVQSGFVGLAAVARVGLFALALGPMLVAFRGAGVFGHRTPAPIPPNWERTNALFPIVS
jgi:hypothetical protein